MSEGFTEDAGATKRVVLVSGSSGHVGRVVVRALREAGHAVWGFDRVADGGLARETLGDVAEPGDWARAFGAAGAVDALVHLAAEPDDAAFRERLLRPNVVGLFEAMEAAERAGVRRVVLASSVQVVSGVRWTEGEPISAEVQHAVNHYGLTKCWMEQVGRMYAERRGLASVIAARIGWCVRDREEYGRLASHAWGTRVFVSQADVGRFFVVAVESDHAGYGSYWCMGPGGVDAEGHALASKYDLELGRVALGFEPADRFPSGIDWLERASLSGKVAS